LPLKMCPYLIRRHVRAGRWLDDEMWTLAPLVMRHADHRRHCHGGVAKCVPLDLLRTNPLASRLYSILRPVGYCHEPFAVDPRNLAGVKIAVNVQRCIILAVIACGRSPALDEEMPRSLAVMRNRLPVVAHQSQVDAQRRPPLPDFECITLLRRLPFRCPPRHVHCAERGELGHAPTLRDLDAQDIFEL